MASESILITGAAGFIGSSLAGRLLKSGGSVVGVDNFDRFYDRALKERNLAALDEADFRFAETDILDREGLLRLVCEVKPAAIYHFAALAGVRPSIDQPARFARVNVDGLINVLDAARAAECPRVVFASSSSVYGNNEKVPFAEDDRVDEPISPYAATKKAGELICHAYSHLYGPAQRPDLAIARFMRLIASGEPVPMFGDGTTSRDYTYIDDIIDGVLAAGRRIGDDDVGRYRIWNLGGSSPIALRDMIDAVGRVVGRTPAVERLPMHPGDVNCTWADLTRSRAELGFEPATSFEVGLNRQWEWMRFCGLVPAST